MPDNDAAAPTPDASLNADDPGDLILERFRYQVTYAGLLAVSLADDKDDFAEIYCELHEDILIKHTDGTFTGIQVKTKELDLPPFNITDEAIKKAFLKFVKLEVKYKGQFRNYSIVSNTGFDKSKAALCIRTLIDDVTTAKINEKSKSKFWAFIKGLAKDAACPVDDVLDAIKKIRVKTFCNLDDIHSKLIIRIKECPAVKGLQESKIEELADLIIARQFRASSMDNNEESTSCFLLGVQSSLDEIKRIIDAKRTGRQEFTEWLNKQKVLPVVLLLKDRNKIGSIPREHRKLVLKMDAGGIDADNIDLMRNFKYAFESHAISWLHKDGPDRADEKYNQVSFVTLNTCKEIYDKLKTGDTQDGLKMLNQIRVALKARKQAEPALFFDCVYEHLLGAVGILTENCKVWWGAPFQID